ncbi:MAG TPA: polysaccharide deacetylase family protein [Chitinophagaceae bacterium]|nr:polysaccharide deacetylase family protein [Chitinophagaceae bacterium]HMU58409.1 polysaccharide deacetylase family protein [Chitinophagaceae bacterium]
MILFTNKHSSRLDYIIGFAGNFFKGEPVIISNDISEYINYAGPKINYSEIGIADNEIRIQPHRLLFEAGISEQKVECFDVNGYTAFFKTDGSYPFDIFAASFYLLSRYEEYLPHQKDEYGRYAHTNSIAYKEGFLSLPLINIWFEDLRKSLQQTFRSFTFRHSHFTFIPTYDIDEAWAYKNKEWWRNTGGIFRDILSGNFKNIVTRLNVLRQKQQDPYDTYDWIDALNAEHNLSPVYFFLSAVKRGKYDKNISPESHQWRQLTKCHSEKYATGIHPSWRSGDEPELLDSEIATLEKVSVKKKIVCSRQHYIRFTLPQTFRKLIESGITEDYSMGYGSINGFRASVATPFYWYDLDKEQQTPLLVFPFCFMDANSFYEQKLSADVAYEELMHYYTVVKSVNGTLITIWHNNFLGNDKRFEGWKEIYTRFIESVSAKSVS